VKVWISKYALSDGLYEIEAERSDFAPSMVTTRKPGHVAQSFHVEGREWHLTRESAAERAEVMKAARIASLHKQIKKLERMSFAAA
jgi:hypothetical protein